MYRLVDVDMTDKVFQKISKAISDNLCEMMEITFGELDEDGIFSDEERINRFMYGNEYLCDYEENHKYFVPIENMLDYKYVNPKDIDFKKSRENNYEDLIYKGFIMEERFSFPLEQDVQDKLHLMAEIQWESIVDDGYHEEDDTVEVKDPITGEVSTKRYRDLFCECYKFLSNLSIYDKTSYYANAMEIYEGEEEDFAELFGLAREDTPIVHNFFTYDDDHIVLLEQLAKNPNNFEGISAAWSMNAEQMGFVAPVWYRLFDF